ncbi:Extracellular serine proteinase [Monoraphidium neglectum]|uniref:Extracellular serine proteinase n=1 Tax=Monoraphidium neglectum TaxID=145388 RepID=A0A0D2JQR4_9CHLO|nr:Extracellular serine proteinase [Monoraphidium neglectum]KIZ01448.1 Extracellular serine proteinase [Monoraphidium neglectum]|eukprot:XP_013900467.1 Extracellular serine proteinase [Monoraphidium neglectum]
MAPLRPALALLLAFLVTIQGQQASVQVEPQTATEAVDPIATVAVESTTTVIYKSGFGPGWRDASYGCIKCASDTTSPRDTSTASFTASVAAWGALVLAANQSFPPDGVLDFWVRGSGVMFVSIFLEDTRGRRFSKDVRLSRPDLDTDVVTIHGSDDAGWIHISISVAGLADSSGADGAKAATEYNRVVFKDVSGVGFKLALDDVRIVQAVSMAQISDAFLLLQASSSRIAPLFNADLVAPQVTNSRYIVRFKESQTLSTAQSVCDELKGSLPAGATQRFRGFCDNSFFALQSGAQSSKLAWRFVPVTVKSADDLKALRTSLADKIQYVEADLTAYAYPTHPKVSSFRARARSLSGFRDDQEAAAAAAGVPAPAPVEVDGDTSAAEGQAVAAESSQGGAVAASGGVDVFPPTLPPDEQAYRVLPAPDGRNGTVSAAADVWAQSGARSWGQDRMDQLRLPLDGVYNPGDLDGRGVHGVRRRRLAAATPLSAGSDSRRRLFVIDTGLRASHADFRGRVGQGATFVGNSYADDHGHGTHASGTAVGAIHGIARSATLHPVKALDSQGAGSYSNIISGMQWVKSYVANNGIRSAVVSLSLGGPRSAALNDAAADLTAAGITDALASYSNIGSCLSVFAPGSSIVSAGYTDDNAESTMSGTSMATPHVAGAAALYLQAFPGAAPAAVKRALQSAALRASFDPSSAPYLALAIASRLRPSAAPAPTPSPTATPKPSPSPQPTAPTTTNPLFPSFGFTKPSWCSSCPACAFCS